MRLHINQQEQVLKKQSYQELFSCIMHQDDTIRCKEKIKIHQRSRKYQVLVTSIKYQNLNFFIIFFKKIHLFCSFPPSSSLGDSIILVKMFLSLSLSFSSLRITWRPAQWLRGHFRECTTCLHSSFHHHRCWSRFVLS